MINDRQNMQDSLSISVTRGSEIEILDEAKMHGNLMITVFDEASGKVKQQISVPNLVVTAGKGYIASRMVGVASTVMSHMAIGSSATAPVVGDTALGTQLGIVALTSFTASGSVVTATATFPAGTGTGSIVEAGIFNAASAGTMLCRTTFPVVTKGAADAISITWTVTVS